MRIDISLLVRVMYQPSRTFGVFLRGPNFEALLPVLAIAVLAAISSYLESPQREVAGGFGLVVGLLAAVVYIMVLMVLQPALNAMWVFVLRRYVGRSPNIGFSVLFTAFILCALPMYVGFLLEFVSRSWMPITLSATLIRSCMGCSPHSRPISRGQQCCGGLPWMSSYNRGPLSVVSWLHLWYCSIAPSVVC
jgi:hypothetical protein